MGTWLTQARIAPRTAGAGLLEVRAEQAGQALEQCRALAPARLRPALDRLAAAYGDLLRGVRDLTWQDADQETELVGVQRSAHAVAALLDGQVRPEVLRRADGLGAEAASRARLARWLALALTLLTACVAGGAVRVVRRHVAEAEDDLADQRETHDAQSRELAELQAEFISSASHELRTPLTSIRGYLHLLREEPDRLEPDQLHALAVADRNADRLLDVIGDLLTVNRVDGDCLELDLADRPLAPVVAAAVRGARAAARAKGVDLVHRDDAHGLRVHACADATRQVLDHLLSNAVKFTAPGDRVVVEVVDGASGPLVRVSDTGPGIRVEDRERVFVRFWRSAEAVRAAAPGTGLGLSIAEHLARAQGGTLELRSAEGFGSTFTLALPRPAPRRPLPRPSPQVPPAGDGC